MNNLDLKIPSTGRSSKAIVSLQRYGMAAAQPLRKKRLPRKNPKDQPLKSETFQKKLSNTIHLFQDTAQETIDTELEKLLADTYALHLKTQNFCWNASDRSYKRILPEMKREEKEMRLAVNKIAERIQKKGRQVPGTLSAFESLTSISEQERVPDSQGMIKFLQKGHQKLEHQAKKVRRFAKKKNDLKTEKLAYDRVMKHKQMFHDLLKLKK